MEYQPDTPCDQRVNAGVIFIGAAAHSGSTLLGVMLGAHPLIFYAGEARKSRYFGDPSKPLKKRVCRLCGPGCVVWDDLSVEHGEDLYERLSRRTRRPIVFDSSKRISWIKHHVAALRDVVPLHLIVLARDGRAVVNSRCAKQPEIPARDHAVAWVEQMRGVEELASHWPRSVHRLRYEELATRPELTLRALVDFIGVAFDPGMLDPWNSDQHVLGSNDGPLLRLRESRGSDNIGIVEPNDRTRDWHGAHSPGIVLDLRWKNEMSPADIAVFEEVAGETNRAYAWEEYVGRIY
jgi:Sulfotransferase family